MFDEWMSRTKENQGLPWTVSFFAEEKGAKHLLGGPLNQRNCMHRVDAIGTFRNQQTHIQKLDCVLKPKLYLSF